MGKLEGRVVLITGAGRGLGHGVARGLAAEGAHVLAAARTDAELDDLAQAVGAADGKVETIQTDLADQAAVDALAREVLARHAHVDALINNAAILRLKAFPDLPATEFDETIAVNLLAPVRLTRALLPSMMAAGRGAIVNVTSQAGIEPFANEVDYCTSKYGLEGYSLALALDLKPYNISVNLVTPGAHIKPTSVTAAEFAAWPARRRSSFRDPIELAEAFAFLVLQDGRGVTGQRFSAAELAERLRTQGWERVAQQATQSIPTGPVARWTMRTEPESS
jgi:NAD(P)-dependent dehydrogenase (short-subunit alcohol dehydrogenase family)